jgi:hypothetical protein
MSSSHWIFALVVALLWAGGLLLYESDRVTEDLRPPLSRFDLLRAILEGAVFIFFPLILATSLGRFRWSLILLVIAYLLVGLSLRFLRRKIPTV